MCTASRSECWVSERRPKMPLSSGDLAAGPDPPGGGKRPSSAPECTRLQRATYCARAAAMACRGATPGSELVVIENASHLKNLEQPTRYVAVVRDFLRRNDGRPLARY